MAAYRCGSCRGHARYPKFEVARGLIFCRYCGHPIMVENCLEPTTKRRRKKRKKKPAAAKKNHLPGQRAHTYGDRNVILGQLGFRDYRDYLASPMWAAIRRTVFGRKGNECDLCGEPAVCLHHQSYDRDTLTGRSIVDIHPICEVCHKAIEFHDDGSKRAFAEARSMFLLLKLK